MLCRSHDEATSKLLNILVRVQCQFCFSNIKINNNTHVHVLYILHFALRIPLKPVKEPRRCHIDGRIYKSVE